MIALMPGATGAAVQAGEAAGAARVLVPPALRTSLGIVIVKIHAQLQVHNGAERIARAVALYVQKTRNGIAPARRHAALLALTGAKALLEGLHIQVVHLDGAAKLSARHVLQQTNTIVMIRQVARPPAVSGAVEAEGIAGAVIPALHAAKTSLGIVIRRPNAQQ